jgi:hypothetical protein
MNPGGGRHQRRCSYHELALRRAARLASVREIFGDGDRRLVAAATRTRVCLIASVVAVTGVSLAVAVCPDRAGGQSSVPAQVVFGLPRGTLPT